MLAYKAFSRILIVSGMPMPNQSFPGREDRKTGLAKLGRHRFDNGHIVWVSPPSAAFPIYA
jgi:hypothetical protein